MMELTTRVISMCLTLGTALIIPMAADGDGGGGGGIAMENLAGYQTTNTFLLSCHEKGSSIDQGQTIQSSTVVLNYLWIVPSGDILRGVSQTTNTSKHAFLDGGYILRIQDASKDDFGLYLCLVFARQTKNDTTTNEILRVVTRNLNGNNWTREATDYTGKIQYGFLAGFVVLVVMGMVCYNYDQHQERHDVVSCEKRLPSSNGHELNAIAQPGMEQDNRGFNKDETVM